MVGRVVGFAFGITGVYVGTISYDLCLLPRLMFSSFCTKSSYCLGGFVDRRSFLGTLLGLDPRSSSPGAALEARIDTRVVLTGDNLIKRKHNSVLREIFLYFNNARHEIGDPPLDQKILGIPRSNTYEPT